MSSFEEDELAGLDEEEQQEVQRLLKKMKRRKEKQAKRLQVRLNLFGETRLPSDTLPLLRFHPQKIKDAGIRVGEKLYVPLDDEMITQLSANKDETSGTSGKSKKVRSIGPRDRREVKRATTERDDDDFFFAPAGGDDAEDAAAAEKPSVTKSGPTVDLDVPVFKAKAVGESVKGVPRAERRRMAKERGELQEKKGKRGKFHDRKFEQRGHGRGQQFGGNDSYNKRQKLNFEDQQEQQKKPKRTKPGIPRNMAVPASTERVHLKF